MVSCKRGNDEQQIFMDRGKRSLCSGRGIFYLQLHNITESGTDTGKNKIKTLKH